MEKTHDYVPGAALPWQYKYPHMAVTTDCVIFTYEDWTLKVLLVRRGGEPYKGSWAFPGGFLRLEETAMEGALRELREETSLTPSSPIVQLGVFSDVDRDPRERVITIAWYALVKPSEVVGGDDAAEAAWFPVDDLPSLAFDHAQIFSEALERLRQDIHFKPVGFDLLDDTFTIPDLQRLYETILNRKFDRRNFQRKMMASGILEEADEAEAPDLCLRDESPSLAMCAPERAARPRYVPLEDRVEVSPAPKKRPGRIGSLFRLNRKNYERMKEEGDKFEF